VTRTFLTRDELEALTSYKQRRKQIAWLRDGGWPFVIGGDGHPRVLRDELVRRLSAVEGTIGAEPRLRFG
jgi:hypothetical protein